MPKNLFTPTETNEIKAVLGYEERKQKFFKAYYDLSDNNEFVVYASETAPKNYDLYSAGLVLSERVLRTKNLGCFDLTNPKHQSIFSNALKFHRGSDLSDCPSEDLKDFLLQSSDNSAVWYKLKSVIQEAGKKVDSLAIVALSAKATNVYTPPRAVVAAAATWRIGRLLWPFPSSFPMDPEAKKVIAAFKIKTEKVANVNIPNHQKRQITEAHIRDIAIICKEVDMSPSLRKEFDDLFKENVALEKVVEAANGGGVRTLWQTNAARRLEAIGRHIAGEDASTENAL